MKELKVRDKSLHYIIIVFWHILMGLNKDNVLDAIFEKWLHKVTFWYQVPMIEPLSIENFFEFDYFIMSISMDFDAQ